eukprot:TRINITY_DN21963_c0_g1_i1.p1 TRINITY_DN21963_c0_g1~~TRINITY_DN21963_c0_g1_i1.p1  ORF type:complete len:206 (-),score=26.44 TRINITY_DN21963_c0_g1_i1:125-709(-)
MKAVGLLLAFVTLLVACYCVPFPHPPISYTAHMTTDFNGRNLTFMAWVDKSLNATAEELDGYREVTIGARNSFSVNLETGSCVTTCKNGSTCNGGGCGAITLSIFAPFYDNFTKYGGSCGPKKDANLWLVFGELSNVIHSYCFTGNTPLWMETGSAVDGTYRKFIFLSFKPGVANTSIFHEPANCRCPTQEKQQ